MNSLKLNITVSTLVEEVFAYAIDSNNISEWYPSIKEEIPSEFPVKLGTKIKNRGEDINVWSYYEVTEFEENRVFTLSQIGTTYHVRYTFAQNGNSTDLEYHEWVDEGELEQPADIYNLELLKRVLEQKKKTFQK